MPHYLVLPYTVLAVNRKKPFREESEYAAILCLAEAKRKKGGVLGGPVESIRLFSKLHYPIWVFPWKSKSLFVDGLGISGYSTEMDRSVDASLWIEKIIKESRNRSRYINTLNKLLRACRRRRSRIQISFRAVIPEKNLLDFLLKNLKNKRMLREEAHPSIVKPLLNERRAKKKAQLLINCYEETITEVKGLEYLIETLEDETDFHIKKIEREIEELKEKHEYELLKLKPGVEEKIKQLTIERDGEIKKLTEATEKKVGSINKKRERWERKLQKLEERRERYKARKEQRRIKKDKVGMKIWDYRIKECTKKILEVRKEVRKCKRSAEAILTSLKKKAEKINRNYKLKIQREEDKIKDLKKQIDKASKEKEEEINTLKLKTEPLIKLINEQKGRKKSYTAKLEKLAVPWKSEETELLSVPFYFVQYKAEEKERFILFPPAIVGDCKGIFGRIKRAIIGFGLEGRINLLLQPQSDDFKELLITLENAAKKSRALARSIIKAGEESNMLVESNFHEILVSGLKELESEGWISREEKDLILKTYKIGDGSNS